MFSEHRRITVLKEAIVHKKLISNFTECFKILQNTLVAEYLNWSFLPCSWFQICVLHNMNIFAFINWARIYRSSRPKLFHIIVALRNAAGKTPWMKSFFKKFTGWYRLSSWRKRGLHCRCFPFRFMKCFRIGFSQESSGRLLPKAAT